MKRILSIALVFCLLAGFSLAEDYSSMTNEELLLGINRMRNELLSRDLVFFDSFVLYDGNGIRLYIDGPWKAEGMTNYSNEFEVTYTLPVVLLNNSDKNVFLNMDTVYVNGWKAKSGLSSVEAKAGKKAKGKLEFKSTELTEEDVTKGPEEIEMDFCFADRDDYSRITDTVTVTIVFPIQ